MALRNRGLVSHHTIRFGKSPDPAQRLGKQRVLLPVHIPREAHGDPSGVLRALVGSDPTVGTGERKRYSPPEACLHDSQS